MIRKHYRGQVEKPKASSGGGVRVKREAVRQRYCESKSGFKREYEYLPVAAITTDILSFYGA